MTSSVLEQWLAREAHIKALHAQGPGPGVADPQWARTQSGLALMQAVMQGSGPTPSIGQTMDFLLIEVSSGQAIFQGQPGPRYLNPMGSVHGGWYATLLDSALGCSVHTLLPPGRAYTTAELSVNIVKALSPKVQRVRAIGQVLHCGRQLATAEARLVGPDGTLYAHATTTCLVFDLPAQSTP
jgi:uncharacterized protein (TIGR00369 family)